MSVGGSLRNNRLDVNPSYRRRVINKNIGAKLAWAFAVGFAVATIVGFGIAIAVGGLVAYSKAKPVPVAAHA